MVLDIIIDINTVAMITDAAENHAGKEGKKPDINNILYSTTAIIMWHK